MDNKNKDDQARGESAPESASEDQLERSKQALDQIRDWLSETKNHLLYHALTKAKRRDRGNS